MLWHSDRYTSDAQSFKHKALKLHLNHRQEKIHAPDPLLFCSLTKALNCHLFYHMAIAGCWCDEFCAAAGDCCDGCNQQCPTNTCRVRREFPKPSDVNYPPMRLDQDIPIPADQSLSRFARTSYYLEREQTCADAIEGSIPFSDTIVIPVVHVSATINGQGGVTDQTVVNQVIGFLNTAYKRAGFSFVLRETVTQDFASFDDAGANVPCGPNDPDNNCNRCNAWNKANAANRNPGTLFMYAVAPTCRLQGFANWPCDTSWGFRSIAQKVF